MENRITIAVGHYGSGKTEFSVNYAMYLKKRHEKTALIDLDIANPYFRSRERRQMLEDQGIDLYSNTYGLDISADLPAITASVRTPLEDEDTATIIDAGGDDSGARVLNQFHKYLVPSADLFFILNANRPETGTFQDAKKHLQAIQGETGLRVSAIVNNTHMLEETSAAHIIKGYNLCQELSKEFQIPIAWNCCKSDLSEQVAKALAALECNVPMFPITLYMRPTWLKRR